MEYKDVQKLFELLIEFEPSDMDGVYEDEELFSFEVSYKETLVGIRDYLRNKVEA